MVMLNCLQIKYMIHYNYTQRINEMCNKERVISMNEKEKIRLY